MTKRAHKNRDKTRHKIWMQDGDFAFDLALKPQNQTARTRRVVSSAGCIYGIAESKYVAIALEFLCHQGRI